MIRYDRADGMQRARDRADGIQRARTVPHDTLQVGDGNEHGVERLALKPRVPDLQ